MPENNMAWSWRVGIARVSVSDACHPWMHNSILRTAPSSALLTLATCAAHDLSSHVHLRSTSSCTSSPAWS
jgi:hypothetical protein